MTTNSGLFEDGLVVTADLLNACMAQLGLNANRPAANQEGRIWIDTDSGDEGKTYRDEGNGTWTTIIGSDAAAAVASLRTIGSGALQGAAGDHTHTITEHDIDEATLGGVANVDQGGTVPDLGTHDISFTLTITETTLVTAIATIATSNGDWDLTLLIGGTTVDSLTAYAGSSIDVLKATLSKSSDSVCLARAKNNVSGGDRRYIIGIGASAINI